jgi:hypothetical protein
MVKPPALGSVGMKVSSHWPGRNWGLLGLGLGWEWGWWQWVLYFDGVVWVFG